MLGAGLASSTRTGSRSNVRQVQVGNKLQGLPPTRNRPVEFALKSINRSAYGEKKTRNVIFCMNQKFIIINRTSIIYILWIVPVKGWR